MHVNLIVAADEAGGIGKDGDLPWRLPADLGHFKRVTADRPLIMGRKTHESIGRSLPGRLNIVLTSNDTDHLFEGAVAASSFKKGLGQAQAVGAKQIMVIGGSTVFAEAMAFAHAIYLTRIHATFDADTFMPEIDEDIWRSVSCQRHEPDEKNPYSYSFILLNRSAFFRNAGSGVECGIAQNSRSKAHVSG